MYAYWYVTSVINTYEFTLPNMWIFIDGIDWRYLVYQLFFSVEWVVKYVFGTVNGIGAHQGIRTCDLSI